MAHSQTRKTFVLGRLAEDIDPMTIWREAEARFGHCGWLYVLAIKHEYDQTKRKTEHAETHHVGR